MTQQMDRHEGTKARRDGGGECRDVAPRKLVLSREGRLCFTAFLACAVLWHCGGCLKPDLNPIERSINTLVKEVIAPAVAKAGEELSARTAQLQGQGSLINPGYTVEGFASAGPATTFKFTIRAEGVSANLAGAGQADAGQTGSVPPPAIRKEAEKPGP